MERRGEIFLLGCFVKLQSGHRPYIFYKRVSYRSSNLLNLMEDLK